LLRGNEIRRVTTDHTWVQEALEKGIITPEQARDHPNVHVIRRHLGGIQLPEVDFRLRLDDEESDEEAEENEGFVLQPGDMVLVCSDGLTDMVWDDEIYKVIRAKKDVKVAAEALVDLANERGGPDNITVVLMSMPRLEEVKKRVGFFDWLLGED
jgi:protein phosphatase